MSRSLLHKSIIALLFVLAAPFAKAACELEITAPDTLAFDQTVLEVDRSCETVKLTLTHTGQLGKNVMGHNWVLSNESDVTGIANDGFNAGLDNDYVTPGDARVLAYTKIIGGGEKTSIEFSLAGLDASEYTYFCSFPGHWTVMKGVLKIS